MILLLGSTGLLGSHVFSALRKLGLPLRVMARGGEDWQNPTSSKLKTRNVEIHYGDALDKEQLAKALDGCRAVVNSIGALTAKSTKELHAINYETVANICELIPHSTVRRLVHVSCLGARETSNCEYLRAKWLAEQKVRESSVYWTIFRTSYLFGETFPLYNLVEPMVKFRPFLPVLGSGLNLIQPVSAPEVAECIVQSIYNRDTVSKCFEMAGTKKYSVNDFMELLRRKHGLSGPTLNVPLEVTSSAQNSILKAIPGQWLTSDFTKLLTAECSTDQNDLELTFGLKSQDLEGSLDAFLAKK
jgi:NADH dehydrogenase